MMDLTPSDLREIGAHLGAALAQAIPSDDAIIIGHVRAAYALVWAALNSEPEREGEDICPF